ncbi:MAG: 16S rRNA (guanine(966)-N(2))-methyltransferase RsmD [Oscillospiraceae bacterium]|nr:16S rRNA (guanine(966)-N(2))-methyltransferase RsmD [Oscillospiraceae bacterium]
MRVIAGTAGGRRLKEPQGESIRPTSDMVKEAVFNIIQFDIEGRKVLDLFAGTGQMGVEALSRGAGSVAFVDRDLTSVRLIRQNLKLCGFEEGASVYARDALTYLKRCEPFDIILMDPPYKSELAAAAVARIIEFDKLNVNGIIICETRADMRSPEAALPYVLQKEYRYGQVKIARYERRET